MASYEFFAYDPAVLPFDPGTGTFTLDPAYDFQTDRTFIEIEDDDTFFDGDQAADEVGEDANQTGVVTFGDGAQQSGQIYVEQYAVLEAPDGTTFWLDRIEIDGQLVGYSPSMPMDPGVTYTYVGGGDVDDTNGGNGDSRMTYSSYEAQSVPCFATGTRIATPGGQIPVQWLRTGDQVMTRDFGPCEVKWAGRTAAPGQDCVVFPAQHGGGPAHRELVLSLQHRVLLAGPDCDLFFGASECLAPAIGVAGLWGSRRIPLPPGLALHHILLERHALINAEGRWVESMLIGDATFEGTTMRLGSDIQDNIGGQARQPVLPCLRRREAALIRDFRLSTQRRRKMRVA